MTLKVIKFTEYDTGKHRLPLADTQVYAGEHLWTLYDDGNLHVSQMEYGVAQHDCEPRQPITILATQDKQFDSLWVITDE
jgi:hypothetical protein